MIKRLLNLPPNVDAKARNAFWATLILLVVLVLFDVYATYNLITIGSIDRVIAACISYGMTMIVLLSAWSSWRGRSDSTGWLLIVGSLLSLLVSMFTRSGIGVLYALVGIIITSTIASLTLSRWKVWGAVGLSVIIGGVYILMDNLLPPRSASSVSATFIYIMFAILVVGEMFLVLRQSWEKIATSLSLKIVVWTGTITAVLSIILIAYSTLTLRQSTIESAQKEALSYALSQARQVRADTEIPLDTARALAHALTAIKNPDTTQPLTRGQVNDMLRQVLIENPTFLGTYTLWEPEAFDGQDANYRGKPAYDQTGRLIPYWIRGDDGSINVIALQDYETPGIGDWYLLPRQTMKEVAIAPLIYPIQGINTVMASFVAPIIYDNKFYGVAGVDAPISFVQKIVDGVNLYNGTAQAILMTSAGTLIGVRNQPELANKPVAQVLTDVAQLQAQFDAGEAFISLSPDGNYLRAFAPIEIGKTDTHWFFGLIIPFSQITSAATSPAIRQATIGFVLILAALVVLWFLSGQITRPVHILTAIATEIGHGNLNVKAEIQAKDETGVLAATLNAMIAQLQTLFNTLEQRVAERTAKAERRSLDLALAAEVGQSVSQVRELNVMLQDAAEIVRAFFGLYYVQVYIINPTETELILYFGTGEVGEVLVKNRHRLPVNRDSVNGRAVLDKRSIIIADTSTSEFFRPNPLLPETRSEIAVPLLIGDKVLGVLDLQSQQTGTLDEEALLAFEPLAGQLAVAIQNTRLVSEAQRARAESEMLARRLMRTGWLEYQDAIHQPEQIGFMFENDQVTSFTEPGQPELASGTDKLAAPISVSGERLGALVVEMDEQKRSSQSEQLIFAVARQVAQQIENLRLLGNAERYRLEAEESARRLTAESWQDFLAGKTEHTRRYFYDLREVKPREEALDMQNLTLPLKIRDTRIGKVAIVGINPADTKAVQLANAVAERLSSHLETLRLSEQTQERARREQALRQITSAVRGSTNPETILRTAVRELGGLLGRKTVVRLTTVKSESAPVSGSEPPAPAESVNEDGGKE